MNAFHFLHPFILGSLILTVPVVVALWFVSWRGALSVRDAYGERRLLQRFADQMRLKKQAPRLVLSLLVVLLLTLSAAGPAFKQMPERVKAGSMQVVAIVNVDPGMAAEDFHGQIPGESSSGPNGSRLEEALYQIEYSLMPAIQGNELGIITNMGGAFVRANLTSDFSPLQFMIDNGWITAGMSADGTDMGSAPCCGDNVAAALTAAVQTFNRAGTPASQRVIVYFGDGGFTSSQAQIEKAMALVNANHIRLVVIGDGKADLPVPIYDSNGHRVGWVSFKGKEAYSVYNADNLRALAALAKNGEFLQLTSGNQHVNWPSAVSSVDKTQMVDNDLYWVPLSLALLLLAYLSLPGGYDPRRRFMQARRKGGR